MKNFFKQLSILLAAVTLCLGTASFSACKEEEPAEEDVDDGFVSDPIDLTGKTVVGLSNAYLGGLLSREDLKNISYFHSGSVTVAYGSNCTGEENEDYDTKQIDVNGEIINPRTIEFTPTVETPVLTEQLEEQLISSYYTANEELILSCNGSKDDIVIHDYLGEYNGHYVINVELECVLVAAVVTTYYVGGIKFVNYGDGSSIAVVI